MSSCLQIEGMHPGGDDGRTIAVVVGMRWRSSCTALVWSAVAQPLPIAAVRNGAE